MAGGIRVDLNVSGGFLTDYVARQVRHAEGGRSVTPTCLWVHGLGSGFCRHDLFLTVANSPIAPA